jgi:ADP-heptose:LPS heptosyltransferase
MKDIAILAIARYGDLIQTTPLLRMLKHSYPDARVTLIVEDRFAGILPMMRGFDRKIVLKKRDIAVEIILQDDPLLPYRKLNEFVRILEADRYDMLINLTCTKFGAHLTSLMHSDSTSGFTADAKGRRMINTPWGIYVFSWFYDNARKYNRINLVDIFTRLGGVLPDGKRVELFETDEGRKFADDFLTEENIGKAKLVGLQLGASEPNRCWPAESFARLSDMLQGDLGVRTIMFGSPGEKHLAEQAISCMKIPAIDAVGKTSLEGLYSLVKCCSALVSNDTGTMHFAAAAGVPAAMLCIGPAFFRGTGPYGEGHLAIQPDLPCSPCPYGLKCADPRCRTAITPDCVFTSCAMLLGKKTSADFSGVKVYKSRFADDGYLTWDTVSGLETRSGEVGKRFEQMWKNCLDCREAFAQKENADSYGEFESLMEKGIETTAELFRASRQSPIPLQYVKELGDREADIDKEFKSLGRRFPDLALIVNYLSLMRENVLSDELGTVAEQTCYMYKMGKRLVGSL